MKNSLKKSDAFNSKTRPSKRERVAAVVLPMRKRTCKQATKKVVYDFVGIAG
ncbi:MAG: hypothetical protein AAF431_19185 [Pseudomonadota bacterium]